MELTSLAIAIFAALISLWSFRRSNKMSSTAGLFETFNLASQLTFEDPKVMRDIHGLSDDHSDSEVRAIVALNIILDGYQHYKVNEFRNWTLLERFGIPTSSQPIINYANMERELRRKPEYLNRLLALPANVKRWSIIKETYYESYDSGFTGLIDNLIAYEKHKPRGALRS